MYKEELALNNQQRLIWHKTQTNELNTSQKLILVDLLALHHNPYRIISCWSKFNNYAFL